MATRDKWIERGQGNERKEEKTGRGMTDRLIKRQAGLT